MLDPITHDGLDEEGWKLVVPVEKRERVLTDAHCEASLDHLREEKTFVMVAREYYWPGT